MPHIIVEYTDTIDVDIPNLLNDLHNDLAPHDTVDISMIKTRAIPVKDCIIGGPDKPDQFMHIALKLLPGRSEELKKQMTAGLHTIAKNHLGDKPVALTIETLLIEAESYIK